MEVSPVALVHNDDREYGQARDTCLTKHSDELHLFDAGKNVLRYGRFPRNDCCVRNRGLEWLVMAS